MYPRGLDTLLQAVVMEGHPVGPAKQFRLVISGSPGAGFEGMMTVTDMEGKACPTPIKGISPAEYTCSARELSVHLSCRSPQGGLTVELYKDGARVYRSDMSGQACSMHASAR